MIRGYQPRLDGIRAVAVALVVETHFVSRLHLGGLGVNLFFVLSGYLISRIILGYTRREGPALSAAKEFYWRRALRLSPPLWLAIATCALFGVANMRADWPWHLFYLTNFKVHADGSFGPATTFWSLAVEEQFYLVWFFLLFAIRDTLTLIISSIAVSIVYKLAVITAGDPIALVLLPGAMDFFCLGALIAYAEMFRPSLDARLRKIAPLLLVASFVGVVVIRFAPGNPSVLLMLGSMTQAALSFCVIILARSGTKTTYFDWLAHPILRHLGKIGYGIYVYHYFVPQFLAHFGLLDLIRYRAGALPKLIIELALTFAVSELSWRLIEKPIQRLKPLVALPVRSSK